MAMSLSASRAGRPLPPRKIPGTHFCQRLSRPQGHSAAGRIRLIEKSNDFIGNRTRAVQPVAISTEVSRLHTWKSQSVHFCMLSRTQVCVSRAVAVVRSLRAEAVSTHLRSYEYPRRISFVPQRDAAWRCPGTTKRYVWAIKSNA
jgi:hypothetical protein